jgi:asparagine synthetase B (glutamine-hydrolysing)
MKIVTDRESAKRLAARSEACFHTHITERRLEKIETPDSLQYVVGRKYRGLFDANDGTYVTLTRAKGGDTLIDRDSYGAIPLFYSTVHPIVSTDIRLLIEIEKPSFNFRALGEYLSAAYLTGGRTIYENVRVLMPNETLVATSNSITTRAKEIFSDQAVVADADVAQLLERAIDNSLDDLLERYPGSLVLNLSGGADSTLLLAKMRERDPHRSISTTTYFHEDWRDDLNDWEYANEASARLGSDHRLIKINNESFSKAHKALMVRGKNIFHTYPAAFYAQNESVATFDKDIPIINGSGPDESIIGTEKIAIGDLLSLRSLKPEKWTDHLVEKIEFVKLPEAAVAGMLLGPSGGFVQARKAIASSLLGAPNFVEFQRRYHAITILQDHIQELSAAAQALDREILFPYLTNDIFRIIFSARFEALNAGKVYKSVVKGVLERFMPRDFVHRTKVGFQSPSRPYFKSKVGFGRELSRLLSGRRSAVLNLDVVEPSIRERLKPDVDLRRRYDFLEWTAYNILLLEELRGDHD